MVMSGIVPLGQDLLRYPLNFIDIFLNDKHMSEMQFYLGTNRVLKCRSEIAQQTMSFGADIDTKYVAAL